jgi:hypothetical protein
MFNYLIQLQASSSASVGADEGKKVIEKEIIDEDKDDDEDEEEGAYFILHVCIYLDIYVYMLYIYSDPYMIRRLL